MRITNKMMNSNALYNINNNKAYMDSLNTQMATGKKVNNPSDDPITAIRALRFRGSLSEINQYLDRNVSDALSWIENTQTSLNVSRDIMTSFKSEFTSATNKTNTTADRKILLEGLQALAKEFYSVGNTMNEDRYIFTGYRTSDSLSFTEADFAERNALEGPETEASLKGTGTAYPFIYSITEKRSVSDIEDYKLLSGAPEDRDLAATTAFDPTGVKSSDCYRMQLSYKDIFKYGSGSTTTAGSEGYDYTGYDGKLLPASLTASDGTTTISINTVFVESDNDIVGANVDVPSGGAYNAYVNVKTGSVIFGNTIRDAISAKKDEGIEVKYVKKNWAVGDLKPEHYFVCTDYGAEHTESGKKVGKIEYVDSDQYMKYSVGDSQSITVNTLAKSVYTHDIQMHLNDIEHTISSLDTAEAKQERIKSLKAKLAADTSITAAARATQEENLEMLSDAVKKEVDYYKQLLDKQLSNGMAFAQEKFDQVNLASTTCGTEHNRLQIIQNRLTEYQTTVKTQASDNENITISDVMIQVNEASLSFNAALMVTGKIAQQSLINFI
ncbi:MAG: hypothetical protein J6P05_02755 [Lachnospiraceae bacterium]|nr:hypothetical protein [Lachnospiraceae bacterium]